ncbi:hypothetical protein ACLKA6_010196 [Drosophila palustris]
MRGPKKFVVEADGQRFQDTDHKREVRAIPPVAYGKQPAAKKTAREVQVQGATCGQRKRSGQSPLRKTTRSGRPGLNGVEASLERELGQFRFSFLGATTQRLRKGMTLRLTLGPASGSTGPRRRTQDRADRPDLVLRGDPGIEFRSVPFYIFLDPPRGPGLETPGSGGRAWATLGHPWNEILAISVSHSGVHHLTPLEEDDLASQSEPRGSGGTMRTTQRVSGVLSSSS